MSLNKNEHGPCPLAWGDRVDHPKFGFGRVVSEPVAMCGAIKDSYAPGGYRSGRRGWRMDIEWEDETRATCSMSSGMLSLVERPDAKGESFWEHEYGKHLKQTQARRTLTDGAMERAFRDRSEDRVDLEKLCDALAQERASIEALVNFLKADESGDHY